MSTDRGTLRPYVTMWVVRAGDDLYVRSWRGPTGGWFRAAQQTREGRISAGGVEKDVRVVDAGDGVDDAYRSKYRRYAGSYLEPMLRPQARATTLKLDARGKGTAQ